MLAEKERREHEGLVDHLGRTPRDRRRYQPASDDLIEDEDDDDLELKAWRSDMGLETEEEMADKVLNDNITSRKTDLLVFKDHLLELPELHFKVAVLGPPEDTRGFPAMFARAYCEEAKDLYEADLAVFTGGPDVDPAYYGEEPVPSFYGDEERDYADLAAFMTCVEEGIPMMGVCRGAQFLAAMQGFKLVQDVDRHNHEHSMLDVRSNVLIDRISSVHHQQVIPSAGMLILGTSGVSSYKWLNRKTRLDKSKLGALKYPRDLEAYFIRETCSIGFQGHPEYKNYNAYTKWCLDILQEFIVLNEDVTWIEDRRRIRKELRDEVRLMHAEKKETLKATMSAKEV